VWLLWLGAAATLAIVAILIVSGGEVDAHTTTPHEEWLPPHLIQTQKMDTPIIRSIRVQAGNHAVALLQQLGFDLSTARNIVSAAASSYNLKNINVGKTFKRVDSADGTDVYYNINKQERLCLQRRSGQSAWASNMEVRDSFTRQRVVSGTIRDSLFSAAEAAGMDDHTTMNLVDIFAWDVDFARDLRSGDSFRVVYNENFDDEGKMLGTTILAAEFVNQDKTFKAVRYKQLDGKVNYYTPDGKNMRKAYLKAPVKFTRISSRFSLHRMHPILGYTRAHRGVDYAAPSGTPIHALGDGTISFAGWRGGYGRFVLIRHNNHIYSTAYGHMRRFAHGIKRGVRVKQGQVIGYVGMSGLATGPHLHFEFRIRGVAVNPLTVKHPPAQPIATKARGRFMRQTAPLINRLKHLQSQASWG